MNEYVILAQLKDDKGAVTYGNLFKWLSIDGIAATLVPVSDKSAATFTSINDAIIFWHYSRAYVRKFDIKNVYIVKKRTNTRVMQLALDGSTKPIEAPTRTEYYITLMINNGDTVKWGYLGVIDDWLEDNFFDVESTINEYTCKFASLAEIHKFWDSYKRLIYQDFGQKILEVKIIKVSEEIVNDLC